MISNVEKSGLEIGYLLFLRRGVNLWLLVIIEVLLVVGEKTCVYRLRHVLQTVIGWLGARIHQHVNAFEGSAA